MLEPDQILIGLLVILLFAFIVTLGHIFSVSDEECSRLRRDILDLNREHIKNLDKQLEQYENNSDPR